MSGLWAGIKAKANELKHSVTALFYAIQDPSLGWLPRFVAGFAVAYALSPLDLIPDFIPVLGLVDDILILPLLLWVALKLIPEDVWERAIERADLEPVRLADNWGAAIVVFFLWDATCLLLVWLVSRKFGNKYVRQHLWVPAVAVGGALVLAEAGWSIWVLTKERRQRLQSVEPTAADPLFNKQRLLMPADL